jgi:hypothetical protein
MNEVSFIPSGITQKWHPLRETLRRSSESALEILFGELSDQNLVHVNIEPGWVTRVRMTGRERTRIGQFVMVKDGAAAGKSSDDVQSPQGLGPGGGVVVLKITE